MKAKNEKKELNRIDIHHHILPPAYLSALEVLRIDGLQRKHFPKWSIEQSLKMMDENKISKAITSVSSPGVYFKNDSFSRNLARICNEYSANLIRRHPERFGAFASLPLPDVNGALTELDYAIDELQLDGIILMSNVNGKYLGESEYEELFKEINKRGLTVFIHPNNPPKKSVNPFVEYTHDITRTIGSLLASDRLLRYSNIRYILAHAGGTIPFALNRLIAVGFDVKTNLLKMLVGILRKTAAIKRMYFDTAAIDYFSLQALLEIVKTSHILFGTNYFWSPESVIQTQLEILEENEKIDKKTLKAIVCSSSFKIFS